LTRTPVLLQLWVLEIPSAAESNTDATPACPLSFEDACRGEDARAGSDLRETRASSSSKAGSPYKIVATADAPRRGHADAVSGSTGVGQFEIGPR
jgi:hypothetical protein